MSLEDIGGLGQLVAAPLNVIQQQKTNKLSGQMANEQMNFQERMANTSHQREVKDLIAAGLNPILSATGGAPSPGGAMPSLTAPRIEMPDMLAYGISLKRLEQADRQLDINDKMTNAEIARTLTDTQLKKMQTELAKRGQPRAILEGEAAEILRSVIKEMKDDVRDPQKGFNKRSRMIDDAGPTGFTLP